MEFVCITTGSGIDSWNCQLSLVLPWQSLFRGVGLGTGKTKMDGWFTGRGFRLGVCFLSRVSRQDELFFFFLSPILFQYRCSHIPPLVC